jgi:hypothetical protein
MVLRQSGEKYSKMGPAMLPLHYNVYMERNPGFSALQRSWYVYYVEIVLGEKGVSPVWTFNIPDR